MNPLKRCRTVVATVFGSGNRINSIRPRCAIAAAAAAGRRTRIKDAQSRTLATVRPSRRDVRAAQSPTVIRHGLVSHLAALYTRPGRVASAVFLSSPPLPFSLILSFTYRHRRHRAAAFCEFWRGCSGHGRRRMPFSFRLRSRSSFDRDASWLTKLNLTDRTDIRTESKISSFLRSHAPGSLFSLFYPSCISIFFQFLDFKSKIILKNQI